jgi:hypothetical protein
MSNSDKIKITIGELELFADVAEIFEDWIIQNPTGNNEDLMINDEDTDEEAAMKQSSLYAKTYIKLYTLFLLIVPRVPKEELDLGDLEIDLDPKNPNAKIIKQFMDEVKIVQNFSSSDKKLFTKKIEKLKGTFH